MGRFEDVKRKNLTEEYRLNKKSLEKEFQDFLDKNKHLGYMVLDRVEKYKSRAELHHKPSGKWETITWEQLGEQIIAVSSGLLELGVKEGDRTGIFSLNRAEWHICDLGSLCIRAIDVPVYATNTTEETEYLINDAGVKVLFVGRQEHYDKSYGLLDRCESLEYIIVFQEGTKISTGDKRVMMWDDFLDLGRKADHAAEIKDIKTRCHYDDPATLIYTSGTTGEPKGAVHTHKSIMHNSWSVGQYPQAGHNDTESSMCMLPLTHVLERSWNYGIFELGGSIYYCEDHTQIMDYLIEANPNVMNSAPRFFEKVYSTIMTGVEEAPPIKKKLFKWATSVGAAAGDLRMNDEPLPFGLNLKYKLADFLILKKVKAVFGKNMHHMNAGGAPLNAEIAKFFYDIGLTVCLGYGLTETAPVVVMNGPTCFKFGSSGPAVPLVDFRIDADTGEIQVKGPNVVKEYYNKPKQTKEAFTEDGWFKTGDIGNFDDDGYLYITDRLKDLIITSGGKNIAPQMIETIMSEDFYIEYVAVIGDARNYITALIVPSFDALKEWARKNKITYDSIEDLIQKEEVISFYKGLIDKRQQHLGRVEQIKKFTLLPREFSQEEGEITPTMKVKRKVVENKYIDLINKMY